MRKRIGLDAIELHRIRPAVNEHVVLILSLSGRREPHGTRTYRGHAGRELGEIAEIAVEGWERVEQLRVDVQSDRVLGLDECRLGGNRDALLNGRELQDKIDGRFQTHSKDQLRLPGGAEAGEFNSQLI